MQALRLYLPVILLDPLTSVRALVTRMTMYGQMGFLDTQPINSFVTISVFQCTVSEAQGESGGFSVEAKISPSFKF